MTDIWRDRNPESKQYTWHRAKPRYIASRIDYCLVNMTLCAWMTQITILPSYKSDHLAIFLDIQPFGMQKGRGLWKMNSQILYEIDYVKFD